MRRGVLRKGIEKNLILKGKTGVSLTLMFLRFSRPQIRYRLRNCTNTFFIQIPKNQFLHFSKFEFKGVQTGKTGVSATFMFLTFFRPQNKIASLKLC